MSIAAHRILRTARKAVDWYRKAANVYWLASAVLDPIKTAARYVAATYGMGRPLARLYRTGANSGPVSHTVVWHEVQASVGGSPADAARSAVVWQ